MEKIRVAEVVRCKRCKRGQGIIYTSQTMADDCPVLPIFCNRSALFRVMAALEIGAAWTIPAKFKFDWPTPPTAPA